jgi:PRTRC genetic system protein C
VHPELVTASVPAPRMEDETMVYEFQTVLGTKG